MSENNKEKSAVIKENLIKLRDYFEIKKKLRDQVNYFIKELRKFNYFEEETAYLVNDFELIDVWNESDIEGYLEKDLSGPLPQIQIKFKTYCHYKEPKIRQFDISIIILASEERMKDYIQLAKEGVRKKLLTQEPDYKRYLELKKRYEVLDQ